MGVWSAYMSVYHVWCLQKSEDSIRSPGTGATESVSHHVAAGIEPRLSAGINVLNHCVLSSYNCIIL